ncbi:LOW QUALITY PROTEIN: hypothetical protein V2J09_021480 [Rumex salicifolius]
MAVLNRFCEATGQKISNTKLKLFVSNNVGADLVGRLEQMSGISATTDLGRYLGMSILHKRVTKATYKNLLTKINAKLAGWKGHTLSLAGRVTLARSILSVIPSYAMSSTMIPKSTCDKLDQVGCSFIWGGYNERRKLHLVDWEDMCLPKRLGRLGLRFTKVDVSRGRILGRSIFWAIKGVVERGTRWNIGDGSSVSFWKDWWVGDGPLITPQLAECKVKDLWLPKGDWNWEVLSPSDYYINEALCHCVWRTGVDIMSDGTSLPREITLRNLLSASFTLLLLFLIRPFGSLGASGVSWSLKGFVFSFGWVLGVASNQHGKMEATSHTRC